MFHVKHFNKIFTEDIKNVRFKICQRENPDVVKQNIQNKFQDHKLPLVDEVIELDEQARATQQEADTSEAAE